MEENKTIEDEEMKDAQALETISKLLMGNNQKSNEKSTEKRGNLVSKPSRAQTLGGSKLLMDSLSIKLSIRVKEKRKELEELDKRIKTVKQPET